MYKYFYLGGSSTWGAGRGREIFLFNFSIPMGIEFLIKRGSHVNFVNNLLKRICKDYNLNNNKKRLTMAHIVLISNNNRRKQNIAEK